MKAMHKRSRRLFVNAGMEFPLCHSNAHLLDIDKARMATTPAAEDVTCKRCLRMMKHRGA